MDEREVFTFHLRQVALAGMPRALFAKPAAPGLRHAESFLTMALGNPVLSLRRYALRELATVAWWQHEAALDEFLQSPGGRSFAAGWHVRLRLYRRWGCVRELAAAAVHADAEPRIGPVVGLTLARLKLRETLRFTRFGTPVERQVRDHSGKTMALAAMRPLATFCTFSVWRDEHAMVGMVRGRDVERDGTSHAHAMQERVRRDFHREFTTMRLVPLREVGVWRGRSDHTRFHGVVDEPSER